MMLLSPREETDEGGHDSNCQATVLIASLSCNRRAGFVQTDGGCCQGQAAFFFSGMHDESRHGPQSDHLPNRRLMRRPCLRYSCRPVWVESDAGYMSRPAVRMIGQKNTQQPAPWIHRRVSQTRANLPVHVFPLPRATAYQHDRDRYLGNVVLLDSLKHRLGG